MWIVREEIGGLFGGINKLTRFILVLDAADTVQEVAIFMRETILAELHGNDERNRLGICSSPLFPLIVDIVYRNAVFWCDEVLYLKALSDDKA